MRQTKRAPLCFRLCRKRRIRFLRLPIQNESVRFHFERGAAAEILRFAACGKSIPFRLAATTFPLKRPFCLLFGAYRKVGPRREITLRSKIPVGDQKKKRADCAKQSALWFYFKNPATIFSSASSSVRPSVISLMSCSPAILPMAASWISAAST